jgi:hypothetical protein
MPNELSGQPVYVDAPKIVEFFTPKAENTGSADDRDLDALAVEDISVHGNPLFPIRLQPRSTSRRLECSSPLIAAQAEIIISLRCIQVVTNGESEPRQSQLVCDSDGAPDIVDHMGTQIIEKLMAGSRNTDVEGKRNDPRPRSRRHRVDHD